MKTIDLFKQYGSYDSQAWNTFHKEWSDYVQSQGCAWVKVDMITAIKQTKENWTITYKVKSAIVTQPIRPGLALELLDADLVGVTLWNAWFIVNPTRIEELVRTKE